MSDENDPYYTDAEQRREAINTILDCTRYWPSRREHIVFKGLLADIDRLRAELAQRTAERDEARRELCIEHLSPEAEARRRGWDCFGEGER
jgi:hypothetical protein